VSTETLTDQHQPASSADAAAKLSPYPTILIEDSGNDEDVYDELNSPDDADSDNYYHFKTDTADMEQM